MTRPEQAHANPHDEQDRDHDGWPPDTVMAWNNRRLLADRKPRWPDGALDACEQIDVEHPGWSTMWREANTWSGNPAGFYAHHERHPGSGIWDGPVYGATPADVRAEIEAWVLPEPPPFRPLI